MRIERQNGSLRISDLPELRAALADALLQDVEAALAPPPQTIEIDLSATDAVDAGGLGVLILLHERTARRNGDVRLRLLHPRPAVRHLLEWTRMQRVFEVVPAGTDEGASSP
jgi:anti-anti-sigma factor